MVQKMSTPRAEEMAMVNGDDENDDDGDINEADEDWWRRTSVDTFGLNSNDEWNEVDTGYDIVVGDGDDDKSLVGSTLVYITFHW